MQAITTRYSGPTAGGRGSAIIAKSASGERLTYKYRSEDNASLNHANAAWTLAKRLGWVSAYQGAYISDSHMAWVPVTHNSDYFAVCAPGEGVPK